MAKGLKCWKKEKGHNGWTNQEGKRVSISYVLNGEHKGEYDVTLGSELMERGTRKVLLEKHFGTQTKALRHANSYMRKHDKC